MSERDERMKSYVDLEGMKSELDSKIEELLDTTEKAMKASSKREIRRYQKLRAEQQKTVDELMEDFEQVFEVTSEGLEDLDRDMYDTFLGGRKKDLHSYDVIYRQQMKKQSKQMKGFFRAATDGWEDLEKNATSFTDIVNTLNIGSIKDSLEGGVADTADHLRDIQKGLNLTNDQMDDLKDDIKDSAKNLSSLYGGTVSSQDLTEAIGYAVSEIGIRDRELAADYGEQLAVFKRATQLEYDSIDELVKSMSTYGWDASVLTETADTMKKLSTKYAVSDEALSGAIEQMMGNNERLANGDADKYRELENSLMKATALLEDSFVDSSKVMDSWSKDYSTFMQDSAWLNAGGVDTGKMYEAIQKGQYDKAAEMYMQGIKNLDSQYGDNKIIRDQIRESLDITESEWERMVAGVNANYGKDISSEMDKVIADSKGGLETSLGEADQKKWHQKLLDKFGLSDIGFGITNFIDDLDIDLTDIWAAWEIGKNVKGLFSKGGSSAGSAGGFFSKIKGFFTKGSGAADDVAKASGGFFSKFKSFFSKGAGSVDDAAKAVTPYLDDAAKGGSKIFGKFFSNFGDDAAKIGSKALGKVGGTVAKVAPWLSFIEVAADAYEGTQKSQEWFGENATGQQTISSGLGAAIGGTGGGWGDDRSFGEKALDTLGNTLKGAGVGAAIGGPIGAAIGAAVGLVGSAIGGENIAKFVDGVTTQVTELADATVRGVSGVLNELGPVGELAGNLIENQWDNVLQTKQAIEDVWADPDKGIIAKIGGTLVEGVKGAFNSVKGVLTTVKDWGKKTWNTIKEKAGAVWDKTKEFAKKAWDGIKDTATKVWGEVKEVAGAVWDGFLEGVDTFAEAGATLLEAGGSLLEGAGKLASGIGEGIGKSLSGAGSGAGSFLSGLGDGIGKIIGGFTGNNTNAIDLSELELTGDPLYDRLDVMTAYLSQIASGGGSGSGGGLIGGVLDAGTNIIGGIANAGGKVVDGVTGAAGFIGDSIRSGGEWLGDKIKEGGDYLGEVPIVGGLLEGGADLLGGAVDLGGKAVGAVGDGLEWVGDKVSDGLEAVGGFFKGLFGSHKDGLDYVPFDGYLAQLHKGERVLTKEENEAYTNPPTISEGERQRGLVEDLSTALKENEPLLSDFVEILSDELIKVLKKDSDRKTSLLEGLTGSKGSSSSGGFFGGIVSSVGNWFGSLFGKKSTGSSGGGGTTGGGTPASTVSGTGSESDIWNFFAGKGLTSAGIAGLMGNLFAESGLRSTNLQNSYEKSLGYSDSAYTSAVDSGSYSNFVKDSAGYGLAQWTYHSRKQKLLEFARKKGKSIGDLSMQLEFLYDELSGSYGSVLNILKSTESVQEASDKVLYDFERPASPNSAQRAGYAQSYLNKFAAYAQGTPWVPNDQVAMVHEGEMIIPRKYNPLNKNNSTVVGEDMRVGQYESLNTLIDVIRQGFSYIGRKIDNIKIEVATAAQGATAEAYSPQFFKAGGTV